VGHDADLVRHHGHPVQGGLPIEQHDVAVHELPLDRVSDLTASATTSAFFSVTRIRRPSGRMT